MPQSAIPAAAEEIQVARPVCSPIFWLFAAIAVIYAFAEGRFSSWAVIFLRDGMGLPDMTASLALSAFWGALVAGGLLASVLIVRAPAWIVWIALPAPMIAAIWLVSLADSAATRVGAFAVAGLACSAFLPLPISLAVDRDQGVERALGVGARELNHLFNTLGAPAGKGGPDRRWPPTKIRPAAK